MKEQNANLKPVFQWLTLIWEKVAGVAETIAYYTKTVSLYLVTITVICFLAELIGIVFSCKPAVFIANTALIICLLIGEWFTKEIAGLIIGIGEMSKKTAKETKEIGENIKQTFSPLRFIATIFSFVSAWIMINGFDAFGGSFYIIGSVLIFICLVAKMSKLPTIIMSGLIFISLFFWYADNCDDSLAASLHSKTELIRSWTKNNALSDETKTVRTAGIVKEDAVTVYINPVIKGNVITSATENNVYLPKKGEIVEIISTRPKIYDGEKLIEVRMAKANGHFTGGAKIWMQPELLEIGNNLVLHDGYALVELENKTAKDTKFWKIYFISDTINIPLVPLGAMYIFSGIKQGELFKKQVDVPSNNGMVQVITDCGTFNADYSSMTLSAKAGSMVLLSTRPATVVERKRSTDYLSNNPAPQQNVTPPDNNQPAQSDSIALVQDNTH
jgi:hypothetical protein